jgi:periplasmic divalent cation tolerance protein
MFCAALEEVWAIRFLITKIASFIVLEREPVSFIIVIMTAPNKQEAINIVRTLLEERLISCANILDSIHSLFRWEGKIEEEKEVLTLMKSQESFFKKLSERITELHSYDVPEILSLPIAEGSQLYLEWMKNCLKSR